MTVAAMPTDVAVIVGPLTLEDELAAQRERFAALSAEWNEHFQRQGVVAKQLRACGARVEVLSRIKTPDPIPGYNEAGGAR